MKKILTLGLLMTLVSAMTVNVGQTGADPGKIMKGELFTVTASQWSGECTSANIDFTECPVCSLENEEAVKSISGSSISWSTIVASQTASNQKITVSLSGCSPPESETSSGFEVILPPDLSVTVSPTSFYDPSGSKQISLTVENAGENTAQDVYAAISLPSGVSTSDSTSKDLGDLEGESSAGTAWTISFSSSSTSTITIDVSSSNAGTVQKTVPITVPIEDNGDDGNGGTGGFGGGPGYTVSYAEKFEVNITNTGSYSFQWNRTLYKITFGAKFLSKLSGEEKSSVDKPATGMRVYKYVQIEDEGTVYDIVLKFAIPRSWLELKEASTEDVVIKKLVGEEWEELATDYVGSDSTNHYYEVELGSLSLFAVGISGEEPEEEPSVVESCPGPTDWSDCTDGKQTRTVKDLVDGKCISRNEVRDCSSEVRFEWPPWLTNLVIIAVIAMIIALVYYFFRMRGTGMW